MFTDKTGTITKNLMEFKTVSIQGRSYGEADHYVNPLRVGAVPNVTNVDFKDESLFEDLKTKDRAEHIENFFFHLAVCHTILVEQENGQPKYNASSPDELALVMGAKFCGFDYIGCEKGFT